MDESEAFMAWTYHTADRSPSFQHYRKRREPTPDDPRTKQYGYRYPEVPGGRVSQWRGWTWRKPDVADSILFRLPVVLAQPDQTLVLTEGERDALEFVKRGQLASCHHGGAGKFTLAQAESMAAHRGEIILVADRDKAGAADVTHRYMQLRRVGIKPNQLTIVIPATPWRSDARDHFAAGFGLDDFEVVSYANQRELAAETTGSPDEGSWPALTGEELANFKDWLGAGGLSRRSQSQRHRKADR